MTRPTLGRLGLAASLALVAAFPGLPGPAAAQSAASLFGMGELDGGRFILVAAPIGSSSRSQLNIYEQVNPRRPCFAVAPGLPAAVNPLLATFDFTGICGRYIDANGYSLRIGDRDLATVYRLSVVSGANDVELKALPTSGGGPELLVARSLGPGSGFLKLHFEPGWRLTRRQFRGRSLGHVYIHRESWPTVAGVEAAPASPGAATTQAPADGTRLPAAPPPAPLPR